MIGVKSKMQCIHEQKSQLKVDEDDDGMISTHATDPDELISKENDKVWKLIQEIKGKMHACQKKVFEFPWKNITGSTEPSFMKEKFKTNGGYVML